MGGLLSFDLGALPHWVGLGEVLPKGHLETLRALEEVSLEMGDRPKWMRWGQINRHLKCPGSYNCKCLAYYLSAFISQRRKKYVRFVL